jgi:hypothetical protein
VDRHDNHGRPLSSEVRQEHVQVDAFSGGGRARGKVLTVLSHLERAAALHDQQGRPQGPISRAFREGQIERSIAEALCPVLPRRKPR